MPARVRLVASPGDAFARELAKLARQSGWDVEQLAHAEAALNTTVEVVEGVATVAPDVALYLRPPFDAVPDDPDDRFLLEERLALLWAAAALSDRPVLNRPSRRGLWGRCAASARVTEQRGGHRRVRPEVFCSDSTLGEWPGAWAAEDCHGVVAAWPRAGVGPFRARPLADGEQYEAVTVVGDQAWRRSTAFLEHLALEHESASVATALGLDFAVVWWAIPPDEASATFVRTVATPSLDDVQHHWPAIATAILALLL